MPCRLHIGRRKGAAGAAKSGAKGHAVDNANSLRYLKIMDANFDVAAGKAEGDANSTAYSNAKCNVNGDAAGGHLVCLNG